MLIFPCLQNMRITYTYIKVILDENLRKEWDVFTNDTLQQADAPLFEKYRKYKIPLYVYFLNWN